VVLVDVAPLEAREELLVEPLPLVVSAEDAVTPLLLVRVALMESSSAASEDAAVAAVDAVDAVVVVELELERMPRRRIGSLSPSLAVSLRTRRSLAWKTSTCTPCPSRNLKSSTISSERSLRMRS
jgi:hypothetical protein